MTLPRPLCGIVPPLVTPLADSERLDLPGLERLLGRIVEAGCAGVFALGSTGEAQALSYSLREEMVTQTCRIVDGRVPVLVGTTDTALSESLRLGERCLKAGASGLVVAPPYYFRLAADDLIRYVETIARELDAPLFLYNIPGLTKLSFPVESVVELASLPQVVGLKDSSAELIYMRRVLRAMAHRPDFSVLIGPEELLAQAVLLGGHGGVCGGANLRPDLYVALYKAAAERRIDDVRALETEVLELSEHVYRTGDPATSYFRGIKCALEIEGICSGTPAPPMLPFTAEQAAGIRAWLRR